MIVLPTTTDVCDYCEDKPAIRHFWVTNKNACGSFQCEHKAKIEAVEKDLSNHRQFNASPSATPRASA